MKGITNDKDVPKYIVKCLVEGQTREDIAQRLGYRNWKSLDIYMRRKGMKWDSRRNIYYSADEEGLIAGAENSKIQHILSMFNHKAADPRKIAEETGFGNHHKMAAFLKANNYIWSHDAGNYILNASISEIPAMKSDDGGNEEEATEQQEGTETAGMTDISKYLPLLELLQKNEDWLRTILSQGAPTVPRYTISGTVRTKSFYMSDRVSRLINDYSRTKNISQKEIVEAAIIEFLCKYSYKDEVLKILNSNIEI